MVRENRKCKHGELNKITNEVFCLSANEFCKHIEKCSFNPFCYRGNNEHKE